MRRAVGLCIHLAHVVLLLVAALDDSRARWSPRAWADRVTSNPRVTWRDRAHERTTDIVGVPQCPMPVWQPDRRVSYAALVIDVDPHADEVNSPRGSCVNPYVRVAVRP
jgi:hypothetical protein